MKVAVTGASGFLGGHVQYRAMLDGVEVVPVGRDLLHSDPPRLAAALDGCTAVVHCAGATRGDDQLVEAGNLPLARVLAAALERVAHPPRVVYANSVQYRRDTVYGRAKRQARDVLTVATPGGFSDVVLANLYGPGNRPFHNSFVATFCYQLWRDQAPTVVDDKIVELVDVGDAAAVLLGEAGEVGRRVVEPAGKPVVVSQVLEMLAGFDQARRAGVYPPIADGFEARLWDTYMSHRPPRMGAGRRANTQDSVTRR